MTDKLADFMVEMATNDTLKNLYKKNPKKLMEIYEIEKDDIELMANNEYDLIKERLGASYTISFNTHITAARVKS
ncbi:MAG: hypothetical protein ACPGJI_02715 [Kangiellaceae bacterium]